MTLLYRVLTQLISGLRLDYAWNCGHRTEVWEVLSLHSEIPQHSSWVFINQPMAPQVNNINLHTSSSVALFLSDSYLSCLRRFSFLRPRPYRISQNLLYSQSQEVLVHHTPTFVNYTQAWICRALPIYSMSIWTAAGSVGYNQNKGHNIEADLQ